MPSNVFTSKSGKYTRIFLELGVRLPISHQSNKRHVSLSDMKTMGIIFGETTLGSVVKSIISLTSSLRGQLVKYFMTLFLKTLNFFVEKMRETFALQKLLTLFQQKY